MDLKDQLKYFKQFVPIITQEKKPQTNEEIAFQNGYEKALAGSNTYMAFMDSDIVVDRNSISAFLFGFEVGYGTLALTYYEKLKTKEPLN